MLSLENFHIQEKSIKNSSIIEQLSSENQELKLHLKNKIATIEKHEHGELELQKIMNS